MSKNPHKESEVRNSFGVDGTLSEAQLKYARHVISLQYPIDSAPLYMALPVIKPAVKLYRRLLG